MNRQFRLHDGCCGHRHDDCHACHDQHRFHPHRGRHMNLRDFRHVKFHDCKCGHDHHVGCDHFHRHGVLKRRDCCIPLSFPRHDCDPRIQLRLGGLTDNLNFQLLRHEGCPVEVEVENGVGKAEKIRGTICSVGFNFVDILLNNKTTVTLMTERIIKIHWTDPKCAPCDHHHHALPHDHDH